ncbi:hypothetical protein M431DRAFT_255861 [Trichoderma harzianum CBS 226.95]|uniref:Uncharacterized protein n=1 Tax=Trichoderma harzianum CBS 226.95 TaxID=983964 RepID=A0A2T4A0E1_TRIHA|nr:hypothetical protein M431DRAFT_255861 [Trichoderma harzianum CBS 226.95]PTB50531.1 hypothetical protein M431DRAFT_255861 [Trichoderma harzianum CBS 226.95]
MQHNTCDVSIFDYATCTFLAIQFVFSGILNGSTSSPGVVLISTDSHFWSSLDTHLPPSTAWTPRQEHLDV